MIAKEANVSTGIIYQYFNDKHDILIAGIKKYGDDIFFPIIKPNKFDKNMDFIKEMIDEYIKEHKVSKDAHEEIMSMVHTDREIAKYYYEREMNITNELYTYLKNNKISDKYLLEKAHIIIGLIDNLCHEVTYHKHDSLNYKKMTDIVINNINHILKIDL